MQSNYNGTAKSEFNKGWIAAFSLVWLEERAPLCSFSKRSRVPAIAGLLIGNFQRLINARSYNVCASPINKHRFEQRRSGRLAVGRISRSSGRIITIIGEIYTRLDRSDDNIVSFRAPQSLSNRNFCVVRFFDELVFFSSSFLRNARFNCM